MNYYNDSDHKACAWLRELMSDGLIPQGVIDERSIADVQPADLAGYTQCHFFAGIGGWSYALQLAGWSADQPVWTGSCPCQPFSVAGKGKGAEDKRHLWPEFARLICKCRPSIVFGEQVAAAIGHQWLDGVFAGLEAEGYACGAAVFGAHSVGAPHIRQRLYWVAHTTSVQWAQNGNKQGERSWRGPAQDNAAECGRNNCGVDNCISQRRGTGRNDHGQHDREQSSADGESCGMAVAGRDGVRGCAGRGKEIGGRACVEASGSGDAGGMGHASVGKDHGRELGDMEGKKPSGRRGDHASDASVQYGGLADAERERGRGWNREGGHASDALARLSEMWDRSKWHYCRDGKTRRIPVEPALFPLAHGVPGRVGLLRGAGNAIVPQVAAAFIRSSII